MIEAWLWLSLVVLGYTYLGYPLALALATWRRPPLGSGRAVEASAAPPLVSAVVPVWNGASALEPKLGSLLCQDYPAERIEILVYCDGCTDDSEARARAVAARPAAAGRIRVFAEPERRGKPAGLNRLVSEARGELVLLGDVRQTLAPGATRALAAALADPAVGCATGRLVLAGEAASGVYWRYEEWIRAHESRFRGVVGMTGPIAMLRRADFVPLPEDVILDDVWLPMRLGLSGRRVTLVPEAIAFDQAFADARELGRKVRTLAGNYQLFARMPALLVPFRNPLWLETVSHKLLRLSAPWWLMVLLGASVAASLAARPGFVAPALLVAQAVFYLGAAAGQRAGRLAAVARTFVVLNLAALLGFWRFLSGRQRVTW